MLGAEYERLKRLIIDKDRELEDARLRGDFNRKSIIDKEIRELTTRFMTEKEYLDREITLKEREIAELRSRGYQLTSSSSQNLNKSQEIRILRDAVSQKHDKIERLKKSSNSPFRPSPGDSEKVTKLSTDNERLRMELREKDHEIEAINARISKRDNESQQILRDNRRLKEIVTKVQPQSKNTGWCC